MEPFNSCSRQFQILLYNAALVWTTAKTTAKCGRKGLGATPDKTHKVLGKAVYYIRFPIMLV